MSVENPFLTSTMSAKSILCKFVGQDWNRTGAKILTETFSLVHFCKASLWLGYLLEDSGGKGVGSRFWISSGTTSPHATSFFAPALRFKERFNNLISELSFFWILKQVFLIFEVFAPRTHLPHVVPSLELLQGNNRACKASEQVWLYNIS